MNFDKFLIDRCYYPEHWEDSQMEEDVARIKSLGFKEMSIISKKFTIF